MLALGGIEWGGGGGVKRGGTSDGGLGLVRLDERVR